MAKGRDIKVTCPCCGASLTVDPEVRGVIAHQAAPVRRPDAPDLNRAGALLQKQAERREALFRQSSEDERLKSRVLERKFEEALKRSKGEPIQKPTRDIDLD